MCIAKKPARYLARRNEPKTEAGFWNWICLLNWV